jgi:hypothetical protein
MKYLYIEKSIKNNRNLGFDFEMLSFFFHNISLTYQEFDL